MLSTKTKSWLLSLFSTLLALLFAELFFQTVSWFQPKLLGIERQSEDFLIDNEYWKVWHLPNSTTQHSWKCINAEYSTNEFGMKDDVISEGKPRIAIIGDSYVEGYGVPNSQSIPQLLEQRFNHDIEVLNFGTSGGFGNVHSVSLYENYVHEFDPDIVIVSFLSYNDLYDNVAAIDEGFVNDTFHLNFPTSDSSTVFEKATQTIEPTINQNLPFGLYVPYFIKRGYNTLESYLQVWLNVKFEFSEIIGLPFYTEEPKIITNGYTVLENSLIRYKELDASNLILLNFPTPFQVDENWKETFAFTHQVELDIRKTNKRLEDLTDELNITLFDPLDRALSYVDSTNLDYPYFFNVCDKHLNAKGYDLMAEWLGDFLIEQNYIVESAQEGFILPSN